MGKHFLISLLLILSFAGWGKLILKRLHLKYSSPFEEIFFSISGGICVSVIYIAFLSIAGILYKPLLLIIPAGLIGLRYIKPKTVDYIYIFLLLLIFCPQ